MWKTKTRTLSLNFFGRCRLLLFCCSLLSLTLTLTQTLTLTLAQHSNYLSICVVCVLVLYPWPLVSAYFWGFWRGMRSMKADKLVRERIAEELELISVTATSSGIQATTQQRWDRIYPFLKQLGWKYRKGGLDGFCISRQDHRNGCRAKRQQLHFRNHCLQGSP